MKLRTATTLSILVLTGLIGISCTQGTLGIFASLQRETKILDRGLENGLTATGMAVSGTPTTGYYYLAAVSAYVRPRNAASGVSWAKISPPANGMLVQDHGIQVFNTSLVVAAFYDGTSASSSSAVYYRTADSSTDAGSWTKTNLQSNGATVLSIGGLFYIPSDPANGLANTIYACVQTAANNYVLYYSTNGTSFLKVNGSDRSSPYIDAVTDTTTQDVFITSASVVTLKRGADCGVHSAQRRFQQRLHQPGRDLVRRRDVQRYR